MRLLSSPLVKACGTGLDARVETSRHSGRVDHVWVTMDCGLPLRLTVSINTWSLKNDAAGFDPRVRMGRVSGMAEHFPPRGFEEMETSDYARIEATSNVFYEHFERRDLEQELLRLCAEADCLEAWGAPYFRNRQWGIHQVHSRRASCAVLEDTIGRDGGLKFFRRRDDGIHWTMVLLKFCGQP